MANKHVNAVLEALARESTPESEPLVYQNPALVDTLEQQENLLAQLESSDEHDEEAALLVQSAIEETKALLDKTTLRIRWRHPRRSEAETMHRAAELKSREALSADNRENLRSQLELLTNEELVEQVLRFMGKGQEWVEDKSLATPRGAIEAALETARGAVEPLRDILPTDTAGLLAVAFQAFDSAASSLEIDSQLLDPEVFVASMPVHLTEVESNEIANADDPHEANEEAIGRHLLLEAERRIHEHRALTEEWSKKSREELVQRVLRGCIEAQRASITHYWYIRHRIAMTALVQDGDQWYPPYSTVEEMDEAENHEDEGLRLQSQRFIGWLTRALEEQAELEAQVGRVIHSRQFPGAVGSV